MGLFIRTQVLLSSIQPSIHPDINPPFSYPTLHPNINPSPEFKVLVLVLKVEGTTDTSIQEEPTGSVCNGETKFGR